MRLFVYEFVTGGGLIGQDLPRSMVCEADMMVRALLEDLAEFPGIQVLTMRDPRLPPIPGSQLIGAAPGDDPCAHFERGLERVDAAWPIAPETGGTLERLARATLARQKTLLGSAPEAIRVTASKHETFELLSAGGIRMVPTFSRPERVPPWPGRWVVKPADGAGSEGVRIVADWSAARARLQAQSDSLVAQPWVDGEVRSLSLICAGGHALLLSVNRQQVRRQADRLWLTGITVNDLPDRSGELARLAENIAAVIPALWGYVGVDFVVTAAGPMVLEINPRLTTSYCGLRVALGANVAGMILRLRGSGLPSRRGDQGRGKPVEIKLEIPGE